MDHSANSLKSKALCSKEGTPSDEESGWTTYLEDFMSLGKKETSTCSSSLWGCGSSSMVSDANSCNAWRSSPRSEEPKYCKKLSLKKRNAEVLDDDPLEDTASSVVNNRKLACLNFSDVDPRKKDEDSDLSQKKGVAYGNDAKQSDGMKVLGFNKKTNDCIELKKRGLCLVSLSMLLDFLG